MSRQPLEENAFFSLLRLIYGFVEAIVGGIWLFLKVLFRREVRTPLRKTHFLESLHYFMHDWPKSFWKFPTGLWIGRSVWAFASFLFKKESSFEEKKKNGGFTLVEMMLSVTLFAVLMVMAFAALGNIGVTRHLVQGRVDINEQLYTATEQLSTTIKEGGNIDYEEYFNRSMVGLTMTGGHYMLPTGFGNYGNGWSVGMPTFWTGHYYCRSWVGVAMGTGGCFGSATTNSLLAIQSGSPQRYGEYKLQFLDHNSDANDDTSTCAAKGKPGMALGDSNCDGKVSGDDDDEDFGSGPEAFSGTTGQVELYLIKRTDQGLERMILRRRVELDPNAPSGYSCNVWLGTGSGCIGRLEMLRLIGKDFGINHDAASSGSGNAGLFDGKVDTWECHSDFNCAPMSIGSVTRNIPTGNDSEWVSLFSPDIDVRGIRFFPVPTKDFRLSWKEVSPGYSIASYVRFTATLGFGWERRKKLKVQDPEVTVATTVTLDN